MSEGGKPERRTFGGSEAQPGMGVRGPRYLQLADLIMEDIASQRHELGSLLPTEAELCRQHQVSRHTVREALRRLQDLGMISRRAGIGTRVEASAPVGDYFARVRSSDDLLRLAAETRLEAPRTAEVAADADLAATLGCQPGRRWFQVSGVRVPRALSARLQPPICWHELYVDPSATPIRERLANDNFTAAQYDALVNRFVIEQEISATLLDAERAPTLDDDPGAPALRVVRRYYDERRDLIAGEINLYPGNRYSITMTLQRDRAL